MQEEIFKPIPLFEGKYEASNLGRIKRVPYSILNGGTWVMLPEIIPFGLKIQKKGLVVAAEWNTMGLFIAE